MIDLQSYMDIDDWGHISVYLFIKMGGYTKVPHGISVIVLNLTLDFV